MVTGGAWKAVHEAGNQIGGHPNMLHLKPSPGSCVLDLIERAGVAALFCTSC